MKTDGKTETGNVSVPASVSTTGRDQGRKGDELSMGKVLLALQETEEKREVRIRSLFKYFDSKNVGYLDRAQIEAGLSAFPVPSKHKYAKDLFRVCDSDQDGRVDYKEFRQYMDNKELELYSVFQSVDVERNGIISPEELMDALNREGKYVSILCLE